MFSGTNEGDKEQRGERMDGVEHRLRNRFLVHLHFRDGWHRSSTLLWFDLSSCCFGCCSLAAQARPAQRCSRQNHSNSDGDARVYKFGRSFPCCQGSRSDLVSILVIFLPCCQCFGSCCWCRSLRAAFSCWHSCFPNSRTRWQIGSLEDGVEVWSSCGCMQY